MMKMVMTVVVNVKEIIPSFKPFDEHFFCRCFVGEEEDNMLLKVRVIKIIGHNPLYALIKQKYTLWTI